MKKTLKRELKVFETIDSEANVSPILECLTLLTELFYRVRYSAYGGYRACSGNS